MLVVRLESMDIHAIGQTRGDPSLEVVHADYALPANISCVLNIDFPQKNYEETDQITWLRSSLAPDRASP